VSAVFRYIWRESFTVCTHSEAGSGFRG